MEKLRIIIKNDKSQELFCRYHNWELCKINKDPENPLEPEPPAPAKDSKNTEEALPADEVKVAKFARRQRRSGLDMDSQGVPTTSVFVGARTCKAKAALKNKK